MMYKLYNLLYIYIYIYIIYILYCRSCRSLITGKDSIGNEVIPNDIKYPFLL